MARVLAAVVVKIQTVTVTCRLSLDQDIIMIVDFKLNHYLIDHDDVGEI